MQRNTLAALAALLAACSGSNVSPAGDGGTSTGCLSGQVKFDGVCLILPTLAAGRTPCGDVTEFCDPQGKPAPQLGCLTETARQHPATPSTVTLTGFIHPFSSGNSNSPVTVEIYRAADLLGGKALGEVKPIVPARTITFEPAKASDPTQFRACDTDAKIGCVAIAPDACKVPVCNDGLSGRSDGGKYCRLEGGGMGVCNPRLRWEPRFSIDDVPTNTPLVIRSTGKSGMSDNTWATLVTWNVFFASDDRSCAGNPQATDCLDTSDAGHPRYQLNVSVLSQSDYVNIPSVAGAIEIHKGLGAVAGEIHDCDNVRLGNVQIGTFPAGDRLTYFNGNPYNTLPESSRAATGTDRLGLYSALNVPAGKVVVVAAGSIGGAPTLLGKYTAYVYPDSVSVVNLNGGKPVQAP